MKDCSFANMKIVHGCNVNHEAAARSMTLPMTTSEYVDDDDDCERELVAVR